MNKYVCTNCKSYFYADVDIDDFMIAGTPFCSYCYPEIKEGEKLCPICKNVFKLCESRQKYCSKSCKEQGIIKRKENYYLLNKEKICENKKIYNQTTKRIYCQLRKGAKKRNIKFDLSEKDFINWYNKQEQNCYYCNRNIEEIKQDTLKHNNRLSIDRKDNNKGYILCNITLACFRCNTVKSNYFTELEMIKIGKIIQHKEYKYRKKDANK